MTYTLEEWDNEWDTIVRLSCDKPRHTSKDPSSKSIKRISRQTSFTSDRPLGEGESLDSLEAIHVYVLANLLCRPIIVIAEDVLRDHDGNPVAPIPFGGIYLPSERNPSICYKYPLVLAYESAHFSALVPADGDNMWNGEKLSSSIPLVDKGMFLLPIKFAIDPGSTWDMVQDDSVKEEKPQMTIVEKITLLKKYLDVVKISLNNKVNNDYRVGSVLDHVHDKFKGQPTNAMIAAKLNSKTRPKNYNEMIDNYLKNVKERVDEQRRRVCTNCSKEEASPSLSGVCRSCYEKSNGNKEGFLKLQRFTAAVNHQNEQYTKQHHHRQDRDRSPKNDFSVAHGIHQMTISHESNNTSYQNKKAASNGPPSSNNVGVMNHPTVHQEKGTIYYQSTERIPRTVAETTTTARSHQPYLQHQQPQHHHQQHHHQQQQHQQQNGTIVSNISPSSCPGNEEFNKIGINCRTTGCKFYGNNQTLGFCSSCYRQYNMGKL